MAKKAKPVSQTQRDYIKAQAEKGRGVDDIAKATGLPVPVVFKVMNSEAA